MTAISTSLMLKHDRCDFFERMIADSRTAPKRGATRSRGGRRIAGLVAGDFDNDARPDLLLFGASGYVLLHQAADGGFDDVTKAAKLPPPTAPVTTAAFVDVDHDGDLDIASTSDALQLLRNNGDGTFTDITAVAGLAGPLGGEATAIAPTDFDNRRDIDLVVAGGSHDNRLYRNMRDGTFHDASNDAGLLLDGVLALAVGDVNKDAISRPLPGPPRTRRAGTE